MLPTITGSTNLSPMKGFTDISMTYKKIRNDF